MPRPKSPKKQVWLTFDSQSGDLSDPVYTRKACKENVTQANEESGEEEGTERYKIAGPYVMAERDDT